MKKIALIDGYGFVFRAYHSLPPLTRGDGTPVGAVYGFTNMLIKLLAGLDVSHVAMVFDAGSKTFRNDIYEDYKANRPPCPEDLKPQFPIVREAAESLDLAILEKAGFEADDIIATLAKKYSKEGYQVVIVSSDKDLMQLIDDNVSMYDAMKNRNIGEKEVLEKFNVKPEKVLDLLSLMGDSADNIPGVRGIGPKTAAELINEYGDLEGIFANLDKIKQKKRKEYLENGQESALLSRNLVRLKEDVEIGLTQEDLELQDIEPLKLIKFLSEQGFRSLTQRVKKDFDVSDSDLGEQESAVVKKKDNSTFNDIIKIQLDDINKLQDLADYATANGNLVISFQPSSENLNDIAISTTKNDKISHIYYLQIDEKAENAPQDVEDLFAEKKEPKESKKLDREQFLEILLKLLADDSIKKVFFDAKRFVRLLLFMVKDSNKVELNAYEDVSLINHLINSSVKNDFCQLTDFNLGENFESQGYDKVFAELEKGKVPEQFTDEEFQRDFYCFKNYCLWKLYKLLSPKIISNNFAASYYSYEKPLLEVLARIEHNGVNVDVKRLTQLSKEFEENINKLTKEIYEISGSEFNIASTKQLGEVLFEKMGLDSKKKSKKTGNLSTKSSVLEELSQQGHEIADKILAFRKFSKLKNTYTDALPKEINAQSNRIHTTLSSISTITGRLASNKPNLQNIPIRSPEGKKIRECFVASKGNVLICADYSQVELRVLAHIANIKELVKAFKEDKDIHKITAAQVFGMAEDDVTSELRSQAKAINFGIVYGISAFGLAKQLGISRTDAAQYIKNYLETYPGIDDFMNNYQNFAKEHGYIETISGRKCYIKAINDKNPMVRAEGERLSINAPIQGSAADVIKIAMINLDNRFRSKNIDAKIILQIHDELIIETKEGNATEIAKIIEKEMQTAMVLDVLLKVDIEIGKSWG